METFCTTSRHSKYRPTLNSSSFYQASNYSRNFRQNDYGFANSTRNSALLWHERPHPAATKSKGKLCSIALAAAAFIVLVVVLSIAGLALYMGALRSEPSNPLSTYSCSAKVTRGDRFITNLSEKARRYRLQFESLYQRSVLGPSLVSCSVERFGNDSATVYFRVTLNRRKIPRHIYNVEKSLKDILLGDALSRKPVMRNVRFDPRSVTIKLAADSETYQRVITKPKELPKPHPAATLKPSPKQNISLMADLPVKKKSVVDEIDIKEEDLPVIQGSFKISKTEADITEKRTTQGSVEVSTQKPKTTTTTKTTKPTLKETSITSALFKLATGEKTTTTTTSSTATTTYSPTTTPLTTTTTSTTTPSPEIKITTTNNPTSEVANPILFSVSPSVFNQEPWVPIYHLPDETGVGPKIPQVNYEPEPKAPQLNYNLQPKIPQLTYNQQVTSDLQSKPTYDQHPQLGYNTPQVFQEQPKTVQNLEVPPQYNFNQHQQPIYTSFTNPGLSFHSFDAEKLGTSNLRGHPIPVNKIAEVTEPSVWQTTSNKYYNSGEIETATQLTAETLVKPNDDTGDLYDLLTSDNNYDDSPEFVEVETLKYVPAATTPENTTENVNKTDKLEKTFNETLQAVMVTDRTDYKLKQSAVLKNISSIFHSLASSLGIAPVHFNNVKLNQTESPPIAEPPTVTTSTVSTSTETKVSLVGQGQAEVIDADELSLMMQTTKVPLVTLLPVKSNSGVGRPIRPRPPTQNDSISENRSFPSDSAKLNLNDFFGNPVKYIETEVVTSVSSEQHKVKMNKSNLEDFKIVSILNFETELPNVDAPTHAPLIGAEAERNIKVLDSEWDTTTMTSYTSKDKIAVLHMNSSVSIHKDEGFQYLTPEKLKQLSEISKLNDNTTNNEEDGVISTKAVSSSYTINHAGFKILTKTFNKIPTSFKDEEKKGTYNSFYLDISNKSDCSNFTVKCGDGQCLPDTTRCNQLVDCNDGSDEKNCNCADYLRSQFLLRKICDGIVDCWDFSDENNCEWCSPGQYVCGNSKVCIDRSSICDGTRDCPHGDDERQCVTVAPTLNAADEFPYHSEGYLMVRKHGKWGKLCVDNFETVVANSETSWEISDLGQAVCKAMTYQSLDNVKIFVENKLKNFYKNSQYYELTYSFQNETKSSLTFENTTCKSGEVVRVKCQSLECGARPQASKQIARIVGGGNAGLGAWPWQAALYKEGEFQCGATLISDKWLLSAGHCFFHSLEEHWVARLGALRRGTALPSPYEQLRPIVQIILHPGYVDAGFINDISLLKLEVPVIFSDYVRPICLPPVELGPRDGRICTVVGWGQLFEIGRIFPDTLQEVQIPVISTIECRKRTLFLPLYRVTDDMFCAGYDRGGRDACLGDSGGPLMCPESDGRWVLHGITSNGYGCARAYRPGVYTKVANYITWINSYMYNDKNSTTLVKDTCTGHRCPLGECLPKSRLCNGFIECSDGSDEVGCLSN